MPVHQLVHACHSKISWKDRCSDCDNDECHGNCGKCLEDIHARRKDRRYNCKNITYYYVCKHMYRYVSEIEHLLNSESSSILLPKWNIISIGCGPCSELFGSIAFLSRQRPATKIRYRGFDLNPKWKLVHNDILTILKSKSNNISIEYHYIDVFDYLSHCSPTSSTTDNNILFLQYVLSDMQQHGYDINGFLKMLVDQVIDRMPVNSIVIVNDINHNVLARDYFDTLHALIRKTNTVKRSRYYFDYDEIRSQYQRYGTMHDNGNILYSVPVYAYKYGTWTSCRSAQLFIHKIG